MDPEIWKQATGTLGVPVVVVVTEMFKKRVPGWPGWAWPLVALFIAFVINFIVALAMKTDIGLAAVGGIVTGYLAMAAYDKIDKEVGDPNTPEVGPPDVKELPPRG